MSTGNPNPEMLLIMKRYYAQVGIDFNNEFDIP